MAGIDYTTVVIKNGNRVDSIKVGPYELSAYKGYLKFYKDDKQTLVAGEEGIRNIPEATDIRTIPLVSRKDIKCSMQNIIRRYQQVFDRYLITDKKTGKKKNISSILSKNQDLISDFDTEELYAYVFRIEESMIFYFPNNPAFGGASYAYVLDDSKNSLSIIISGYGHYKNPLLHWINRGLSKESEADLIAVTWEQMILPINFCNLFTEQCFKGYIFYRDGGICSGSEEDDTIKDEDVLRLYDVLKELNG